MHWTQHRFLGMFAVLQPDLHNSLNANKCHHQDKRFNSFVVNFPLWVSDFLTSFSLAAKLKTLAVWNWLNISDIYKEWSMHPNYTAIVYHLSVSLKHFSNYILVLLSPAHQIYQQCCPGKISFCAEQRWRVINKALKRKKKIFLDFRCCRSHNCICGLFTICA